MWLILHLSSVPVLTSAPLEFVAHIPPRPLFTERQERVGGVAILGDIAKTRLWKLELSRFTTCFEILRESWQMLFTNQ